MKLTSYTRLIGLSVALLPFTSAAQQAALDARIAKLAQAEEAKVIAWRRDFHQHPELGNAETRTAGIVAAHLKSLGLEVQTGVGHTGVVDLLRGGRPGPVVALRADMDALPITENPGLAFASTVKTTYLDQSVGVMHACGHDSHTAMLMGAAEVLSQVKKDLPGTVKFIFQPAEEGSLPGEEGGAQLLVKEGVLENPKVAAIFGVHIDAQTEVDQLTYRPGGIMASSDEFTITVHGKGAHSAYPWNSVDPVVTAALIVVGLQTIVSRQIDLTQDAAVVTVATIQGGVRSNIIPVDVVLSGTIRALNRKTQEQLLAAIRRTAKGIAESAGATAEVHIDPYGPVTFNDRPLTARMLPTLQAVAGTANVTEIKAITGGEDFSYYQEKVPGVYLFVGGMRKGIDPATTADHYSAGFVLDASGFTLGVKTLATLAADYLAMKM